MSQRLSRGTQIAYIPQHAGRNIHHADVEFGFITSGPTATGAYFCRFWCKTKPGELPSNELRTKSNSELTPGNRIRVYTSHTTGEVEAALAAYC